MSYVSTDIKKIIAEIIENKKEKGGVKYLFRRMRRFSGSALSGKDIYGKRGAGSSFSMDQQ
jgi:hypothetical protein